MGKKSHAREMSTGKSILDIGIQFPDSQNASLSVTQRNHEHLPSDNHGIRTHKIAIGHVKLSFK
jgi:hypothetical protein